MGVSETALVQGCITANSCGLFFHTGLTQETRAQCGAQCQLI